MRTIMRAIMSLRSEAGNEYGVQICIPSGPGESVAIHLPAKSFEHAARIINAINDKSDSTHA